MNEQDSPLEFPCHFPIKVMGASTAEFKPCVIEIVKKHIPELVDEHINERPSSNNKYISLTLTVYVNSREQLDNIYRDLHACEHVLMSL